MTKKQWQELYKILNDIHSTFVIDYQTYRNGKNKKIRSDAERKIFNAIHLADYHVKKNPEVYELFTGGADVSDYGRAIIYEEFTRPNYFGHDLNKLLNQIQEKIESLNE